MAFGRCLKIPFPLGSIKYSRATGEDYSLKSRDPHRRIDESRIIGTADAEHVAINAPLLSKKLVRPYFWLSWHTPATDCHISVHQCRLLFIDRLGRIKFEIAMAGNRIEVGGDAKEIIAARCHGEVDSCIIAIS